MTLIAQAYAYSNDYPININENDAQVQGGKEIPPDMELARLYSTGINSGCIYVDNSGLICIEPESIDTSRNQKTYTKLINDISILNDLILCSVYSINPKTLEIAFNNDMLESKDLNTQLSSIIDKHFSRPIMLSEISTNTLHSCTYPALNLGALVQSNYDTISSYYYWCIEIEMTYGTPMEPYNSTVAVWVNYVRPGGSWDYKIQPGYAPYDKTFCCMYAFGSNLHRTSEFIGNYNYGYTGSFLFPLLVLSTASWIDAYAGGSIENEYLDQLDISEGFYDAP